MKWSVVVLLLSTMDFGQNAKPKPQPTSTSSSTQRFTMMSAEVRVDNQKGGITHTENQVFLLDSMTGQVWVYTPASLTLNSQENQLTSVPAVFKRVWVENVDDKSLLKGMQTYDIPPTPQAQPPQ